MFPDVGLVLSTRESSRLRDGLFPLGITLASAGSHTEPGGYTGAGKENIRIDWQVIDPRGKRVGTVSQKNTIPKGSLNGPWGAIANAVAGAAADKLIKIIPKSS